MVTGLALWCQCVCDLRNSRISMSVCAMKPVCACINQIVKSDCYFCSTIARQSNFRCMRQQQIIFAHSKPRYVKHNAYNISRTLADSLLYATISQVPTDGCKRYFHGAAYYSCGWQTQANSSDRTFFMDSQRLQFSDSVCDQHFIHGFVNWFQCTLDRRSSGGPSHVVIRKLIRSIKWVEFSRRCLDFHGFAVWYCTLRRPWILSHRI